jgi:4-hydroxybenzoate polyprenyltransferase
VVHLPDILAHGWLIAVLICILAIGILHLMVGMKAIFVEIGLFVVIIAVAVRKYRPQSKGEMFWFFEVPEWVGLLVAGMFFVAIGALFIIPH